VFSKISSFLMSTVFRKIVPRSFLSLVSSSNDFGVLCFNDPHQTYSNKYSRTKILDKSLRQWPQNRRDFVELRKSLEATMPRNRISNIKDVKRVYLRMHVADTEILSLTRILGATIKWRWSWTAKTTSAYLITWKYFVIFFLVNAYE